MLFVWYNEDKNSFYIYPLNKKQYGKEWSIL